MIRAVLRFFGLPLVPDLHRRPADRTADLVLRTVPGIPRFLAPARDHHCGDGGHLARGEFLARPPPQEKRRRLGVGRHRDRRRSVARRLGRGSGGMRDKLTNALTLLKKASKSRGYL